MEFDSNYPGDYNGSIDQLERAIMKISEVIAELDRLKLEYGDIEVVNASDEEPYFEFNRDPDLGDDEEGVLVVE